MAVNIKHAFTNLKSDGGDATVTRPSNWNADHVVSGTVDLSAADLIKLKRFSAGGGTALVAGDFALSAGWGNTAAVSDVVGTDGAFQLTITCGGSSIAANPVVTLTFKDGTWTSGGIGIARQVGGTGLQDDLTGSPGATTWVLTWNNTPISGKTYIIAGIVVGRT